MAKSTKSLSGAEKDAYLQRSIALEADAGTADRLAARLKGEVTRVWVRLDALGESVTETASRGEAAAGASEIEADDFNPYEPNVIVVLRTAGRERLLTVLRDIATVDRLRLLAREQQLGVESDATEPEAFRLAIIAAAERRIINRRAAAS